MMLFVVVLVLVTTFLTSSRGASEPSAFWSEVLPLCCKSSCERYFRTLDQPDKDCATFCEPLVKQLLANDEVAKALALSSAAYGLNLVQWAMRDVVMSAAEKQPQEVQPFVFVTRMEYYEEQLSGRATMDPETLRLAHAVKAAQAPPGVPVRDRAPEPVDLPHDGSAFTDEL